MLSKACGRLSYISMSNNIIQLLTGDEGNILSSGPTYHMLPESPVNNCFVIPSLVKDKVKYPNYT